MKVQLFVPCFVDQLFPTTAFNMVKVLEKLGCTVSYNSNQTCCGQPAFNAGFQQECKSVATKFIEDFKGADYIVAPSASCIGFLRNHYPTIFENGSLHTAVKLLVNRSFEFTEFLTKVIGKTQIGARLNGKATYHDSCAGLRECHIKEGPRSLLQEVQGLELLEMSETDVCCGFGGSFAVKFEPVSVAMAEQKITNATATEADFIISTDLSCLMHIDGVIRKKELKLKTMHIADVLASGW